MVEYAGPKSQLSNTGKYRFSKFRRAWIKLTNIEASAFIGKNEKEGNLDFVNLRIFNRRGNQIELNLDTFTTPELIAFKELLDIAFAHAIRATRMRDQKARELYEKFDDDSDPRLYRPLPQLVIREGEKYEHYPQLLRGCDWPTDLVERDRIEFLRITPDDNSVTGHNVDLRRLSEHVPERLSGPPSTQDDPAQTGSVPNVRQDDSQRVGTIRLSLPGSISDATQPSAERDE